MQRFKDVQFINITIIIVICSRDRCFPSLLTKHHNQHTLNWLIDELNQLISFLVVETMIRAIPLASFVSLMLSPSLTAAFAVGSSQGPCTRSPLAIVSLGASPGSTADGDSPPSPPVTFPLSVRAALLSRARTLDDKLASGESLGGYSISGWSNRLGTALTPAAIPGVYTGDRPFYWNKVDVGCRMCVIQLNDENDLWVHSPVGLDPATKVAIDKLGTVRYVVSPNYEHLKYAKQWSVEYPDAFMWGCPGVAERLPEVKWEGEIPNGIRPAQLGELENCWDFGSVVPLHLDMEVRITEPRDLRIQASGWLFAL
jgi:hypothetical protein